MVEEEGKEGEVKEDQSSKNNDNDAAKGDLETSPIEEAKKILAEQKATLTAITEERKKIEKATAELLVNGRTFAGQQPQKKEETAKEYAQRVMRGEI
jgi:hypothetical protein